MGKFVAGRNNSSMTYESGTYASTSGVAHWVGLVQSFDCDDNMNVQNLRYHGTNTRNLDATAPGAKDHGGTITYYPQDFRMMLFALGSGADHETGSPAYYTHNINELESNEQNNITSGLECPFPSFSCESIQQFATGSNLCRAYKGCMVDSFTLAKDDNSAPLTATVEFIAKEQLFSSGAGVIGAATEQTRRPYAPFDTEVHLPSGTRMEAKTWEFSIANNIDRDGAHVCNGSREIGTPTPTERDYSLSLTIDGESNEAVRLYSLYKSGGELQTNAGIKINNFGGTSGTSWISLSGCDVNEFDAPNPVEGIDEWSLTLTPKDCAAEIQDNVLEYLPF